MKSVEDDHYSGNPLIRRSIFIKRVSKIQEISGCLVPNHIPHHRHGIDFQISSEDNLLRFGLVRRSPPKNFLFPGDCVVIALCHCERPEGA